MWHLRYLWIIPILVCVIVGLPIDEEQKLIFEVFKFPENGSTTVCIPYYLCDTKQNTTIDIRFGANSKVCAHYLDVSCEVTYQELKKKYLMKMKGPEIQAASASQCGKRNVNGTDFKLMGNRSEAQYCEFPWMVAVLKNTWTSYLGNAKVQCDGTLIHPQVVLTTAQCVNGIVPGEIKVRAGDWDLQTDKEPIAHQERDVQRVIIHEEFKPYTLLRNDIALLVLKSPVNINNHVSTICLPNDNDTIALDACVSAGWGAETIILDNDETRQKIMKKFPTTVLHQTECENKLTNDKIQKVLQHSSPLVCTEVSDGFNDTDKCWGIEGSTLFCPKSNGHYVQVGMKSSNSKCIEPELRFYQSLHHFKKWIDKKMVELKLDEKNSGNNLQALVPLRYILFITLYYLLK